MTRPPKTLALFLATMLGALWLVGYHGGRTARALSLEPPIRCAFRPSSGETEARFDGVSRPARLNAGGSPSIAIAMAIGPVLTSNIVDLAAARNAAADILQRGREAIKIPSANECLYRIASAPQTDAFGFANACCRAGIRNCGGHISWSDLIAVAQEVVAEPQPNVAPSPEKQVGASRWTIAWAGAHAIRAGISNYRNSVAWSDVIGVARLALSEPKPAARPTRFTVAWVVVQAARAGYQRIDAHEAWLSSSRYLVTGLYWIEAQGHWMGAQAEAARCDFEAAIIEWDDEAGAVSIGSDGGADRAAKSSWLRGIGAALVDTVNDYVGSWITITSVALDRASEFGGLRPAKTAWKAAETAY